MFTVAGRKHGKDEEAYLHGSYNYMELANYEKSDRVTPKFMSIYDKA